MEVRELIASADLFALDSASPRIASLNPSIVLKVMCIGSRARSLTPTCDPAIDLNASGITERLSAYERSRSDEDRLAVPLHALAVPVLFAVQPLTRRSLSFVRAAPDALRSQWAFSVACHSFTDASGTEHKAETRDENGLVIAADSWLDKVFAMFGENVIDEIASVAITRAEVRPEAIAPFRLPAGLMLPR